MQIIIVLTVLFATVLGSLSGIGGGVIIKPVMDAVSGLTSSQISFLSGTTVLTMTIVSLLRSRGGEVRIDRRGILLALGAAFGGLAGKSIFSWMVSSLPSQDGVSLVQNIIMVILTVAVFFYVLFKARVHQLDIQNRVFCTLAGLFLGLMSSFLGIGGGPINIMVLSYFFSMDTKTSALNSLYIIFFSQVVSLLSNLVMRDVPTFDPLLLVMMMVCAVIGASGGRWLSNKLDSRQIDVMFLCMLVLITGISVYNCFKYGL